MMLSKANDPQMSADMHCFLIGRRRMTVYYAVRIGGIAHVNTSTRADAAIPAAPARQPA
jgi:hypothetical protein